MAKIGVWVNSLELDSERTRFQFCRHNSSFKVRFFLHFSSLPIYSLTAGESEFEKDSSLWLLGYTFLPMWDFRFLPINQRPLHMPHSAVGVIRVHLTSIGLNGLNPTGNGGCGYNIQFRRIRNPRSLSPFTFISEVIDKLESYYTCLNEDWSSCVVR